MMMVGAAIAQSPPDSRPETVFSVSTTLVQVDALVTNAKGRQVTTLNSADFTVLLDGKPQFITNCVYVPLAGPATSHASTDPRAPIRPENVRRAVVMLVDDLNLSFESMARTRAALRNFVDHQMQPGDLLAIWETGRSNSVFQQLTADREVLSAALNNLRWNPDLFTLPLGTDGANPFRTADPKGMPAPKKDVAANLQASVTASSLDRLGLLMDELRPITGRKAVLFFTDGLNLGPRTIEDALAGRGTDRPLTDQFRGLIDKANRAGAVLYTIDARGLQYVERDRNEGGADYFAKTASIFFSQQPLVDLAAKTGGRATLDNGIGAAFEQMNEDEKGYYLIAFKAPSDIGTNPRHPGFHSLLVRVKPKGLQVHSRSGFLATTDEESRPQYKTPQEQMRAAVFSLFNRSDLRISLTTLYARTYDGQPILRNLLYIDPRDVHFDFDSHGTGRDGLDVLITVEGHSSGPLAQVSRHLEIEGSREKLLRVEQEGILFTLDVPVREPGPCQVRLSVRDSNSAGMASASQFISIPNLRKEHIALTTPAIDDAAAPPATRFRDVPAAVREFHPGARLAFTFLIQTDRDNDGARTGDFSATMHLWHDSKEIVDSPLNVVPVQGENVRAVMGELRLPNSMESGDYYLQVVAVDHHGVPLRRAGAWTSFHLAE